MPLTLDERIIRIDNYFASKMLDIVRDYADTVDEFKRVLLCMWTQITIILLDLGMPLADLDRLYDIASAKGQSMRDKRDFDAAAVTLAYVSLRMKTASNV